MPDKNTPWMLHDMEPMTIVTAKKPGKFIAIFNGRSFDEETNDRHARLAIRAVNRDHLFGELVGALEKIAELQDDKCQTAPAEILYALLEIKVRVARAVLAKVEEAGHG